MGPSNGLQRRSLLSSIAATTGGIKLGAENVSSNSLPEKLKVLESAFIQFTYKANIENEKLLTPASVYCPSRSHVSFSNNKAFMPPNIDPDQESLIIDTHEGVTQGGLDSDELFTEVPIKSDIGGSITTIPGSNPPDFKSSNESDYIQIATEGDEFIVSNNSSMTNQFEYSIDCYAYTGSVNVEFSIRNRGVTEVYSHPNKLVVPHGTRKAEQLKTLAQRTGATNKDDLNISFFGDKSISVEVVEEHNIMLVDFESNGDDE